MELFFVMFVLDEHALSDFFCIPFSYYISMQSLELLLLTANKDIYVEILECHI